MEKWFEKYDIELTDVHAVEHIHKTVGCAKKYMDKKNKEHAYKKLIEAKSMIDDLLAVKGVTYP